MVAYLKPPGYKTQAAPSRYKPFNNYISGSQNYAPSGPSAQRASFVFSAAPADLSQITVPDGPVNSPSTPILTFTFTWGGAPGVGIIPLVGGGGTAAQAATAASVALAAQLTNWTVTNPSATVLLLVSKQKGVNVGPGLVGATNAVITTTLSSFNGVLPGRFGKNYAFFSATPGPIVGS